MLWAYVGGPLEPHSVMIGGGHRVLDLNKACALNTAPSLHLLLGFPVIWKGQVHALPGFYDLSLYESSPAPAFSGK